MPQARDFGIQFEGNPGPFNAITDVSGVEVGHTTIIKGEGKRIAGQGPVRTGVTVILPRGKTYDPVFAGWHSLNGNGEMTGTAWLDESGFLETPIALTNTHSVGVVRDAVIAWSIAHRLFDPLPGGAFWLMPVVAETYDGLLNDINGFHVRALDVEAALDGALPGPVLQGSMGGGTGMICHGFKGGIGTASRLVDREDWRYTVGVLVQANYGQAEKLIISGVPVGKELSGQDIQPVRNSSPPGTGSIIGIVATDAPLLAHQLKRLARRVPLGISRLGGEGANTSGDLFLAFSTANPGAARRTGMANLEMLPNDQMTPFFEAVIQATEEAILNALVSATRMAGPEGIVVEALPVEKVLGILRQYGRFPRT